MVLFVNGNFYLFNVLKNCKRPTIFAPERAIIPYLCYVIGNDMLYYYVILLKVD